MSQNFRLDKAGYINRDKKISFKFNGKKYFGYEGDTLASALLANGIHLVGRSFKYHRPRGFIGAGVDEPNAHVQLYSGAKTEPNAIATAVELVEGLVATSQNCWPSVTFDFGAINNLFNKFHIKDKKIITSCGSGITACILSLSLLHGLNIQTSVYDGSWTEWGQNKKLPISK